MSGTCAVVLDLGGVVVDWNPQHLYRTLIPDDADRERFLGEVATLRWNGQQDRGRPLAEGTRVLQQQHPQHADLIAAYYGRWEEMLGGLFHDTVDVVRDLVDAGVPTYALTNWSAETFPVAEQRYGEALALFDGIVVSGREGVIKPEPEIFRRVAERFALDPATTLFVDDSPGHVDAARALGWQAEVFTGAQALRASLAARGLLNGSPGTRGPRPRAAGRASGS